MICAPERCRRCGGNMLALDLHEALTCLQCGHYETPDLDVSALLARGMHGFNISESNRKRARCQRGHLLTSDNVYLHKTTGYRECRTCRNWRKRIYGQRANLKLVVA